MIRLSDLLKEVENEQLEEGAVKNFFTSLGAAAMMGAGAGSATAQKQPAPISITQSDSKITFTDAEKLSWEFFQKWLSDHGYAGNKIMDDDEEREKILKQYEQDTDKKAPSEEFVKKFQRYKNERRDKLIALNAAGKIHIADDMYKKKKNWDNFQPDVVKASVHGGEDGKVGSATSKLSFEDTLLKDPVTKKKTRVGYAPDL